LTIKESDEFYEMYSKLKAHPMSQVEELEDLAINYETNLKLLGIIGLKNQLQQGAPEFI
jgi:hypothetical protein